MSERRQQLLVPGVDAGSPPAPRGRRVAADVGARACPVCDRVITGGSRLDVCKVCRSGARQCKLALRLASHEPALEAYLREHLVVGLEDREVEHLRQLLERLASP